MIDIDALKMALTSEQAYVVYCALTDHQKWVNDNPGAAELLYTRSADEIGEMLDELEDTFHRASLPF